MAPDPTLLWEVPLHWFEICLKQGLSTKKKEVEMGQCLVTSGKKARADDSGQNSHSWTRTGQSMRPLQLEPRSGVPRVADPFSEGTTCHLSARFWGTGPQLTALQVEVSGQSSQASIYHFIVTTSQQYLLFYQSVPSTVRSPLPSFPLPVCLHLMGK